MNEIERKRTALISGGTRGIGQAIVDEFANNGFNVAFCYQHSCAEAEEICSRLQKKEINCISIKCDVSDLSQVKQMQETVKAHFGSIDTLINNAGTAHYSLFTDEKESDFDSIINQNLKSVFNMTSVFAPDMISQGYGHIVNISSIWGISGASCEALYSASKAAIIGLTKALALEFAPSGITVNAIAPGMIDTDMNNSLSPEDKDNFIKSIPLGRIGKPSEVAKAALYLANAAYVTGEVIKVSGGK